MADVSERSHDIADPFGETVSLIAASATLNEIMQDLYLYLQELDLT